MRSYLDDSRQSTPLPANANISLQVKDRQPKAGKHRGRMPHACRCQSLPRPEVQRPKLQF